MRARLDFSTARVRQRTQVRYLVSTHADRQHDESAPARRPGSDGAHAVSHTTGHIVALQRTAGNRAVARLVSRRLGRRTIQRAITGGARGDTVEHESGERFTITNITPDALGDLIYELRGARGRVVNVYGDVRTYRLIHEEGLAELFGVNSWRGTAALRSNPAAAQFAALRNNGRINVNQLLALVPGDIPNAFAVEGRSQRGFKFEWGNWHVHGHEPDAGAAPGHAGAGGWVVRIQDRGAGTWLLATAWVPQGPPAQRPPPTDWSNSRSNQVARLSHIPLDV